MPGKILLPNAGVKITPFLTKKNRSFKNGFNLLYMLDYPATASLGSLSDVSKF